jgi:hypothetical protein
MKTTLFDGIGFKRKYSKRAEEFCAKYPRKVGKQDAAKFVDRLSEEDYQAALQGISWQAPLLIRHADISDIGARSVPYPATWLHGRRWEDEEVDGYGPPQPPKPKDACASCGANSTLHDLLTKLGREKFNAVYQITAFTVCEKFTPQGAGMEAR